MSVISPRRSSTSNSGSLYGKSSSTTGNTGTGTGSSSGSGSSSAYSSPSSYLNRASSLSKSTTPSSSLWSSSTSGLSKYSPNYYTSYLGSNSSSYSPRTASQRNSLSSLYLSGGSSGLGTYRSSPSYLSAGSNDTITSSRYGLPKSPRASETLRRRHKDRDNENNNTTSNGDNNNDTNDSSARKPPSGSDVGGSGGGSSRNSNRLSGSYSSSSLARLVATSGLEIYEKYSPANYKPNPELSRSSSTVTEADVAAAAATTTNGTANGTANGNGAGSGDDIIRRSDSTTSVTLERPRSRYSSRLYSNGEEGGKYDNDIGNATTTTTKPHRSSYRERAAAAAKQQQQQQQQQPSNALTTSSSATSVLSHSSSNGDVPTATFTLRKTRTPHSTSSSLRASAANEGKVVDGGTHLTNGDDAETRSISRQGSRSNLKSNNTNDLENGVKELKLSRSGSGLHKDSSSSSLTTTITLPLHTKTLSASNSSGHLSALAQSHSGSDLKRNHSANNLDVADNVAGSTSPTNELKASNNAEVYTGTTVKTLDTPSTTATRKMNIRRPCGCH